MVYYSGNPLPVAHVSNELDASHTLEFTTDKTTADHLENLTGKTVIYKDVRGESDHRRTCISGVQPRQGNGCEAVHRRNTEGGCQD